MHAEGDWTLRHGVHAEAWRKGIELGEMFYSYYDIRKEVARFKAGG